MHTKTGWNILDAASQMNRKEKVWFGRWHLYRWGYRKKPYGKFLSVYRLLDLKTGRSREVWPGWKIFVLGKGM
jgi:hypothetical protein